MSDIRHTEILIVGAGIAGLSSAWNLLKAGKTVRLIDKGRCGHKASFCAAGMLAPVNELEFTELGILHAARESLAMYSLWEKELGDIGLDRTGTLELASGQDDIPYLRRLFEFQQKQGLEVFWLDGRALNEKEPLISRDVPSGIFAPQDIQVENRLLISRLQDRILSMGGIIEEETEFFTWKQQENTLYADTSRGERTSDQLVLALGVDIPEHLNHPRIIPVKGEMLRLKHSDNFPLRHVIRIRNRQLGNGYVVPKASGILVGSTSEHKGFDRDNTFGGILDILRKSYQVLPGLYELGISEMYSGLRPATEDHQPVIRRLEGAPVYVLNGLYRHGILLAPWAGNQLSELVLSDC